MSNSRGQHHRRLQMDRRYAVRTGHELRHVARTDRADGPHVRTLVDADGAAQAENGAVAAAGYLDVAIHLARMTHRHQVFAPVLDPLHRPAGKPRRKRNQEILGKEFAPRAEAAADVALHNIHRALGKLQEARQNAAIGERHLGRAEDRHAPGALVPRRHDAARLHRQCEMALNGKAFAPSIFGGRERRVDIALLGRVDDRAIAASLVEQQRRRLFRIVRTGDRRISISASIASRASSASASLSPNTIAIASPT
jgi:hypothetical protein